LQTAACRPLFWPITAKNQIAEKIYFLVTLRKPNLKVNEIPMLFTVETFCKLVVSAVTEKKSCETVA